MYILTSHNVKNSLWERNQRFKIFSSVLIDFRYYHHSQRWKIKRFNGLKSIIMEYNIQKKNKIHKVPDLAIRNSRKRII
jgi:hypothetical protein